MSVWLHRCLDLRVRQATTREVFHAWCDAVFFRLKFTAGAKQKEETMTKLLEIRGARSDGFGGISIGGQSGEGRDARPDASKWPLRHDTRYD